MAVINLSTGEKTEVAEEVEQPTGGFGGRVIDLDTGKPVEPKPQLGVQPIPQLQNQLDEIAADRPPIENQDTRTRAEKELPEVAFSGILSEEPFSQAAKVAPAILTATNPREIGDILTNTFPHIGIVEDEKGNLIAANNKTGVQAIINRPGMSPIDVLQTIGIGAAFTPGAQLAGAVGGGATVAATVGATTAGLTQGVIESLQQAVGGEFNEEEMMIATVLGGAVELVVPAINAIRNVRQAKEVAEAVKAGDDVAGQVRIGKEASDATGIPLFQAQQTTVPAQLEKQSFLAQLPAGTQKASKELAKQNRAASSAVDDLLTSIAPDESIITGPGKIRTAAQNAIDARILARKEKASPLYKKAFKEGAEVDLNPVVESIDTILSEFPEGGEVFKSISKAKKLIGGERAKDIAVEGSEAASNIIAKGASLKKLHNAKIEIDQMISKVGEGSLGNTTKAKLVEVKSLLVDQLDESSDLYRQARETFEAASPPVNKIQESIIGKVANLDDVQLKNASKIIFDPAESNPQVVRRAKRIIQDVDPDAWNQILRAEVERRLGSIKSTLEAGTTENVPGQVFRSLFGNTKQRAVLFNAVDGDAKTNLKFLETALSRARLGRPGGSQTAIREEIKKELRGGLAEGIRTFFGKPVSSLSGAGATALTGKTAEASFNARVRSLTNVMFDPQWKPRIAELRKLSPDSPAAARAMVQLLDDAVKTDIGNLNTEDAPEQSQ